MVYLNYLEIKLASPDLTDSACKCYYGINEIGSNSDIVWRWDLYPSINPEEIW